MKFVFKDFLSKRELDRKFYKKNKMSSISKLHTRKSHTGVKSMTSFLIDRKLLVVLI